MICPNCQADDTAVRDSRKIDDGKCVRRRRLCLICKQKFVTDERIQLRNLKVIKKSGIKKPFDKNKVIESITTAFKKRDIKNQAIDDIANDVIQTIENSGIGEIRSSKIGELVLNTLATVDEVAYIRFASVYKNFGSAKDFIEFIQHKVRK